MSSVHLSIEPFGLGWAIKHNDGFLGHAKTEAEAWSLAESLAAWASRVGRPVELRRSATGKTSSDQALEIARAPASEIMTCWQRRSDEVRMDRRRSDK